MHPHQYQSLMAAELVAVFCVVGSYITENGLPKRYPNRFSTTASRLPFKILSSQLPVRVQHQEQTKTVQTLLLHLQEHLVYDLENGLSPL